MNHKQRLSIMICFILSGSLGFAIQTYAASESTIDPNAERHFEKANELYDASDYNGAIAEYEKITRLSPNSRIAQNAQYWIGQSQFKAGRFDAALATFRGLVDEYPTSAIITSTQLMIGRVGQSKEEKALFEAVEKGDIEQLKLLISKGANVNTVRDQNSVTLLHLAAEQGHTEIAAILVDKGADVNARDKWGETPLHLAALADLAELLIDKGADINAKGSWGEVPLHYAARAGHLDVVELLISKGTDVDAANDWGNRPLLAAVRGGHLEVAKVLISKGADVDAGNDWGARPLLAAARGGHLEVAKVLISKGADVDAESDRGFGPLHAAAARGHLEIIELLLSKGIDINARDGNGNPPLAYAAIVGHLEVAKLLLKRGAYVDSGNKRNLTPLNMAIAGGHQDMVELLLANGAPTWRHGGLDPVGVAMALGSESRHQKEMIRFLIDKGIEHSAVQVAAFFGDTDEVKRYLAAGGDINAQESSWLTLLACAVLGGHKDEAEFLISKGADINRRGAEGKSALHWAVFSNRPEILRMLLDRGANAEIRDVRGHTALFLAAYWDHMFLGAQRDEEDMVDMVKILLAKEADVNASGDGGLLNDDTGWTPLHWPCRNGFEEMVEVLIAHGADVNARSKNGETPMSLAKSYKSIKEILRKHGARE